MALPQYVFLEDHSQPADFYVAKGLPDPGRPWSEDDWKKVVRTLTVIAKENPAALPRWGSPRSSTLFARLLAETKRVDRATVELSPFHHYADLDRRNYAAIDLLEVYFVRGRKRLPTGGELAPTLDREVVEIIAAKLELLPEALETLDVIDGYLLIALAAQPDGSLNRKATHRRADFAARRQHWERYTAAMGNTFTNQARFREPARRRLAAAWEAAVLANISHFSLEGRQRLVNSVTPGLRAETSPEVRRLLATALAHPALARIRVQER